MKTYYKLYYKPEGRFLNKWVFVPGETIDDAVKVFKTLDIKYEEIVGGSPERIGFTLGDLKQALNDLESPDDTLIIFTKRARPEQKVYSGKFCYSPHNGRFTLHKEISPLPNDWFEEIVIIEH